MKKYSILISAAILSIFALSCSKNEIALEETINPGEPQTETVEPGELPDGYVRLHFDADAELTRTAIADGEGSTRVVSWVKNDKVKVTYAAGSTSTLAQEDGTITKFTVDVPQGAGQLYFSYPFDAAVSLAGTTFSLTIPEEQDGLFAGANYVVATSAAADGSVHFYNAGALFKIVLDDATVTKAVITGNNGEALCGTVPFTFTETGIAAGTPVSTGTSLTVNFNGVGTYYVSSLPDISLSDGASIRFFRGTEPAGGAKWSGERTVARSSIASWGNSDPITSRYVKADAAAGGNGRTWATAWGRDELKAFILNTANRTAEQLDLMDGITVKVAAGTYVMAATEGESTKLDWSAHTEPLTVHFVGGYPAAGGDTADPASNETILSGDDKARILWVYQKSYLSFDGFTFSNGSTTTGGQAAVVFNNAGSATLNNCKFTDNVNTATAGALTFNGGGTFSATNCTFTGNTAAHAAGFNMDNAGTKASFTNCTFSGNNATTGNGGAFKVTNGTATIKDCTFTGNTAGNHGGALWVSGGTTTVSGTTSFKGNSAPWGGAVYSNKDDSAASTVATFTGSTFGGSGESDPNTATTKSGGAVACDAGTLNFISCTFTGNTTPDRGGALFITNSGTVVNIGDKEVASSGGSFTGHSALNGGVIAVQSGAKLNLYNSECKDNKATSHGGAICVTAGSPTVYMGGNTFKNNEASASGGAIAVKGSGTLSTPNSPKIYIEDGNSFTGNFCKNGGGAIRVREEPATATTGETAGNETKACLYVSGSNTFTGNYATGGYGGCMDLRTSGTVVIDGATFNQNYTVAQQDYSKGGALSLSDSSLGTADFTIKNCVFDGNYAGNKVTTGKAANGGAINVGGNGTNWAMKTKIYNCLFKDNCGKQAGAIYFLDASAVTWISNCAFTGNYISYRYGTTITIASGTVCMNNCSIADDTYALKSTSNNNSGQQNAWINVKPAKLVMSNCTMIGTTRLDTGVLDNGSSCLLRFDAIGNTHYLINNIIAPTGATRSIWADNSPTINATSNKTGTKTFTTGATYNTSGTESDGFTGTSSCFGALEWKATATPASWNNRYWYWNGTLSTGNNTNKAALADVQTAIRNADSGFADWLESIGVFDKDARGKERGTTTWPGAFDATNE